MHVVPPILTVGGLPLINPWSCFNEAVNRWSEYLSTFSQGILEALGRHTKATGSSAADQAAQQLNEVQWRLYARHLTRYRCRPDVPLRWERERFCRWSARHSKNFRHLLLLYQFEWLNRYDALTADIDDETRRLAYRSPELERLFREIEAHLYQ